MPFNGTTLPPNLKLATNAGDIMLVSIANPTKKHRRIIQKYFYYGLGWQSFNKILNKK